MKKRKDILCDIKKRPRILIYYHITKNRNYNTFSFFPIWTKDLFLSRISLPRFKVWILAPMYAGKMREKSVQGVQIEFDGETLVIDLLCNFGPRTVDLLVI